MRTEALGRGHCRYVPALLDSRGSARNLRACFQLNSLGKGSHVGPGANSVGLGSRERNPPGISTAEFSPSLSDGNEALSSIPSKGLKEEPLQDSEGVTCSGHGLQLGGFGLCLLAKAQLAERHSFLE